LAGRAHDWAESAKQEAASHAASNPVCWPLPAHTLAAGRGR
jgi:hypothetical protein